VVQTVALIILQLAGLVAGLGVVGRSLRVAAQSGAARTTAFAEKIAPPPVQI